MGDAMPDFLWCLGYDTSNPLAFRELVHSFSDDLSAQISRSWKYYYWTNNQGVEFWLGCITEGDWLTFNPHFRSSSLQTCLLTERFQSGESSLDGLYICRFDLGKEVAIKDLSPAQEEELSKRQYFSLLFRPPNYHWYDHLSLPVKASVQMIGFPDLVELYPRSTQNIPPSGDRPETPRYFLIPIGTVALEQEGSLFPLVEFGGTIMALEAYINSTSHKLVYVARVETIGLILDLLIPADMLTETPEPGMVIHTKCWLSGQIKEVSDMAAGNRFETPWLFQQQTNIAGLDYHNLGERHLDFHFWDQLTLKREPDNAYDRWAVAVLTSEGQKLGYISKEHSQVLANIMDQGAEVQARIVNKALVNHHMCITTRIYSNSDYPPKN